MPAASRRQATSASPRDAEAPLPAVLGLPNVQLRLISDVPPSWASDRVEIGPVAPSAVPQALANAHLFALPCEVAADGDRDGVPVAILEAMAAGLPILTTPVSGIPEVVDTEVGWMVRPGDVGDITTVLSEIQSSPRER